MGTGFKSLKKCHEWCSCAVINGHLYIVVPLVYCQLKVDSTHETMTTDNDNNYRLMRMPAAICAA